MGSSYQPNKYLLQLFEFVGVILTEMTYLIAFLYDIWEWIYCRLGLKKCRDLLKYLKNYPKVLVTFEYNSLMNVIVKVFPKSIYLVCWYHISENVREKCKLDVKVKYLKSNDGKDIKPMEVWKIY